MQPVPAFALPATTRIRPRTALVASADRSFRQRLAEILTGLRWQVREAEGGAQAWAEAEAVLPEAVIVDSWLPDLEMAEFLCDFRNSFPDVDLVTASGSSPQESPRGPYRQELLYALRRSQDTDTAVWNTAPSINRLNPAPSRTTADAGADTTLPAFISDSSLTSVASPVPITLTTSIPTSLPTMETVPSRLAA
jgi:CheY-like chemotaxis protein